ncbi:hypothetical protein [Pseudomonas putida]|uniref:hypothetical protein n=1 Tax=Pseudomonas putida TaxID=303 RepID=UPI000281EBFD|nr:hypothetical protein [Pseudomonas putida]EMR44819.1 hypothetical protein PPUTLS46_024943 [Pseudomonas putida LS46]
MASGTLDQLNKYFEQSYKLLKRKQTKLNTTIDLPSEIDKNHASLFLELLDFKKLIDKPDNQISASSLNSYAKESLSRVENNAIELANKHPKYYWKFYLTGFSKDHFKGELETSFLFNLKMFESCISFSEKRINEAELYKNGNAVALEINDSVVKDYCKLVGYSLLLKDLYTLIRISSKGCDFQYHIDKPFPTPIYDNLVNESIQLYDNRNVTESTVDSGMNMPSKSGFSLKQKNLRKIENLLILANENAEADVKYEKIPKTFKNPKEKINTKMNFSIIRISLETIYDEFKLGNEKLPWADELLEIIGLLQFVTDAILRGWVLLPAVAEKGYILLPKTFVTNYIHGFIESVKKYQLGKLGISFSINAEDLIKKYSRPLRGRIYPANTSIIFDAGKMFGFDMSCSFEILLHQLEYTKSQGKIANLRGLFFESQTQDSIDASTFKPASNIRALVAKPLKLGNKQITDLDAILVSGKTLVAISCKSLLVNEDYDMGDYRTIRNITSSIEKYVEEWRSKTTFINNNKVGDNYDLSEVDHIIGLVLTPSVLYCNVSYRNELSLKGLYENMSSHELEAWLSSVS